VGILGLTSFGEGLAKPNAFTLILTDSISELSIKCEAFRFLVKWPGIRI